MDSLVLRRLTALHELDSRPRRLGQDGPPGHGPAAGPRRADARRLAVRHAALRLERPFDLGPRARRRRGRPCLRFPGSRRARRRRDGRRVRPAGGAGAGSSCCRAAASPRRSARRRPCATRVRRPRSCAAAGSPRTSARVSGPPWYAGRREWRSPLRVREPFVDVEDIADVAVAALTQQGHAWRLDELTGPRLLPFAPAVAETSGRPDAGRPRPRLRERVHGRADRSRRRSSSHAPLHRGARRSQRAAGNGVSAALDREPRDFATTRRDRDDQAR